MTAVMTTLATLSLEFPHFIGFTIDDYYCMQQDPFVVPAPGLRPPATVAQMAAAHAAIKAVGPKFQFMPTVYPQYLGVVAGKSGFTLGASAAVPFGVNSSASLTLAPAGGSKAKTSGGGSTGVLSFWQSSAFSYWDTHYGGWRRLP